MYVYITINSSRGCNTTEVISSFEPQNSGLMKEKMFHAFKIACMMLFLVKAVLPA